jgi:hypothetical protein
MDFKFKAIANKRAVLCSTKGKYIMFQMDQPNGTAVPAKLWRDEQIYENTREKKFDFAPTDTSNAAAYTSSMPKFGKNWTGTMLMLLRQTLC